MRPDLFDQAIAEMNSRYLPYGVNVGRRLDINSAPPGTADFLRKQHETAEFYVANARDNWPATPPIEIYFMDSPLVGAWAIRVFDSHNKSHHHFIGITLPAIIGMSMLFTYMMRDSCVLSDFADASQECELPTVGEPIIDRLIQDNKQNSEMPQPKSNLRSQLAVIFSHQSFMFLLFHEISHIAQGHIDYLDAHKSMPYISEFSYGQTGSSTNLTSQVFETHADTMAAQVCANLASEAAKISMPWTEAIQTHDQHMFSWLFSIFMFMRTFGDQPLVGANLYASTHPPFRMRLKYGSPQKFCNTTTEV
jgi:hypothetical protein